MPGFDGKGSMGQGAKTDGKRGVCPGAINVNYSRGFFGFMKNCFGFGRCTFF